MIRRDCSALCEVQCDRFKPRQQFYKNNFFFMKLFLTFDFDLYLKMFLTKTIKV